MPENIKAEIRELTLQNELEKRRKLFQGIGYDLGKMDIGILTRAAVGNLPPGAEWEFPRDSMVKTGTFYEAILAANRKLVLLGLKPYEINIE